MKKKSFARKDPGEKKMRKNVRKAEAKNLRAEKNPAVLSEKLFFRNQGR